MDATLSGHPHRIHRVGAAAALAATLLAMAGVAAGQETTRYSYVSGRLIAASLPGANVYYTWDPIGNRTEAVVTKVLQLSAVSPSSVAAGSLTVTDPVYGGQVVVGGPTLVRISGTGFTTVGSGVPRVEFALSDDDPGLPASHVTVLGDNLIAAVAPGLPGSGYYHVRVTFDGQPSVTLYAAVQGSIAHFTDPNADSDQDGMPDVWEARYGTDLRVNDAALDADADGVSNLDEYKAGTHPLGGNQRYLAEGATSDFFDTRLSLLNPGDASTDVQLRFLKGDGSRVEHLLRLDGHTRGTLDPKAVTGMAKAEFSTVVESSQPVVVDRTMEWDASGYGSHAETSVLAPATQWYLAEGATHSGFDLFYLVQNPNAEDATVSVRYLRPAPAAPVTRTYTVKASSRFNIWVDLEGPELASTDVSAVVTADRPVIVERAMYLSAPGQLFAAGHESAGITTPARSWFLAEGATGAYFDLFVLVANPNDRDVQVKATYLLAGGATLEKTYTVAANSRFNIWVDLEQFPEGSGQRPLADVAVSSIVESLDVSLPIIVERAMWWPGTGWSEAHNSPGTTATGTAWALADGEAGGTRATETYVLVANTSPFAGSARVTVYYEDGRSETTTVPLAPSSRTNVVPAVLFAGVAGHRFATVIESVDTGAGLPQLVVERAMYTTANGVSWAAGTDAVATRLR